MNKPIDQWVNEAKNHLVDLKNMNLTNKHLAINERNITASARDLLEQAQHKLNLVNQTIDRLSK